MRKTMLGAAVLALCSGCTGVQSRVANGRLPDTIDQRPERAAFFEAIGIGASNPALPSETQRRALARDAAIVKAQYELLSMIKGVELRGGLKVAQALEADSALETQLDSVIRGAQVLKSEFTADNGCVVTLRLPKSRVESALRSSLQ